MASAIRGQIDAHALRGLWDSLENLPYSHRAQAYRSNDTSSAREHSLPQAHASKQKTRQEACSLWIVSFYKGVSGK